MATQTSQKVSQATSNTPTTGTTLKEFHLFPNLPPELRELVFKFALFPQLIRVDIEGGNMTWKNNLENQRRTLDSRSLNCPLTSVCRESRYVAAKGAKGMGEDYVFITGASSDSEPARISQSFMFRPKLDTLFFPDMLPFVHLTWNGAVLPTAEASVNALPRTYIAHANIHSIVMGGIFERIESAPLHIGNLSFSQFPRHGSNIILGLIAHLPNLQELVLVSPSLQQLHNQAPELQKDESMKLAKMLKGDVAEYPQIIERVMEGFGGRLEREGKRLLKALELGGAKDNHGVSRPYGRGDPITVSDWWKTPTITWLTEDELKARFGIGKLP